ncbi:hypothetical protein [Cronobacter sakazakii]|uniref:hypothetical protein n=1 Tax=Cronobacter sakazakii TaxID=28141 RepID=UPI000A1FE4EC|nr:hypothetical protein [Cronobacter sakazakii]ELY5838560.1 hypothetical protein [Cronobacter sakazakii]ELY6425757.1 hypothetical protein [Cronobacter sakazakii]PUY24406.1 hypothetical protein BS421_19455 [Cronobacter sakazakii]
MKLYEMEGFLRGKCVPGDLLVNETNAQYLVRKFTELNDRIEVTTVALREKTKQCEQLAAENAVLNNRMQKLIQIINNADNSYCMCGEAMETHAHGGCGHPTGMFDYHYNAWLEADTETPATDAFLSEVRAQGVEMLAELLSGMGISASETSVREFAAQLRNEVKG